MKKTLLLFALGLFIVSCSDDDSTDNTPSVTTSAYLPLDAGNYWVYEVESTVVEANGRDSLYVANDTVIGNKTYHKFKTLHLPTGFFTRALRNNGVRAADGKLLLSGSTTINFTEELPFSLSVEDFEIFNENAGNNEELDTETGTIEQEIMGYDVSIDYTLTSTSKNTLATYTAGGQTYTNVKPVEMRLNIEVTVWVVIEGLPNPIPFTLINPSDVVVSTQYYAENIGMVHAVTDFNYELEETPGFELPMPETGSQHQEEFLVQYNVE